MENKIKTKEVTRIQYYVYCPECEKEIRGNSTEQVDYALKTHLKHKHNWDQDEK